MKKASSMKVFRDCLGIGIDVSKVELVVAGITSDKSYLKRVDNTMKAIEAFAQGLQDSGYREQIVCESTGHYHLKLAMVCHRYGLNFDCAQPFAVEQAQQSRGTKDQDRSRGCTHAGDDVYNGA